ncbi:hypothetical protein JCM33374_g3162 [Metschnikowia sp. JCM 33374]|nr:hypothetical protein JCM33374_g3162 [Metschnikowia sp. JCM 33374]
MTSKPRYARLQVDADAIPDDDKPPQTGHTFNIWYLKWAGGDSGSRHVTPSKFRVNIQKDSGTTRGVDGKSPICLFFARGCCYKGRKCAFLHRLPRHGDVHIPTQDCFGRDKTADYRDDMGGVGSLQRQNTTLYVSGAHMGDHVHEEMHRQFSEFGQIDKIRVLPGKNCAFVSFRLEAEAQFAKEAMDAQSLDGKDILTVKWANDDPNPQAQKSAKRSLEELAMETVHALLNGGGTEGPEGSNKRRNLEGLSSSKGASKEASKVAPKAPKEAPKEPKEAYNDTQKPPRTADLGEFLTRLG